MCLKCLSLPVSLLQISPVAGGRHPIFLSEIPQKRGIIHKPAYSPHLSDRYPLLQLLTGPDQPLVIQIAVYRQSRQLLKPSPIRT